MKRLFVVALLWASFQADAFPADGVVRLNNFQSNTPIIVLDTLGRLPVEDSYVQVFAGPVNGALLIITNTAGISIFPITEPGFFDGGVGFIPFVSEGLQAHFGVRTWRFAPTYESPGAGMKGVSAIFSQGTGSLSQPAVLQMPAFSIGIPEP